mmetsp:Transcript_78883/g.189363  ORF Transcript_78883/g.189363 Transcript_78883/m.189363 type:complete len:247 (-) Transcript_78883:633-1373(-)
MQGPGLILDIEEVLVHGPGVLRIGRAGARAADIVVVGQDLGVAGLDTLLHVAAEVRPSCGHAPPGHGLESQQTGASHAVIPAIQPASCDEGLTQPGVVAIELSPAFNAEPALSDEGRRVAPAVVTSLVSDMCRDRLALRPILSDVKFLSKGISAQLLLTKLRQILLQHTQRVILHLLLLLLAHLKSELGLAFGHRHFHEGWVIGCLPSGFSTAVQLVDGRRQGFGHHWSHGHVAILHQIFPAGVLR